MFYRVVSGVCRIPPDLRVRLSAEQAKSRAHRIVDVESIADSKDMAATTRESVEFKPGEVIGLPWPVESIPRYLIGVIAPVDMKKPAPMASPLRAQTAAASGPPSAGEAIAVSPRRAARSE